MYTKSFKIEDQVWVFVVGGRRVKTQVEIRVPKTYPVRAGITKDSQRCIIEIPKNRFEEKDS